MLDLGFRVVGFRSVDVAVDEFRMIMNEMRPDRGGIVGFFVSFRYSARVRLEIGARLG